MKEKHNSTAVSKKDNPEGGEGGKQRKEMHLRLKIICMRKRKNTNV